MGRSIGQWHENADSMALKFWGDFQAAHDLSHTVLILPFIFVHLVHQDSSPPLVDKDVLDHVIILSCDYTQSSLSFFGSSQALVQLGLETRKAGCTLYQSNEAGESSNYMERQLGKSSWTKSDWVRTGGFFSESTKENDSWPVAGLQQNPWAFLAVKEGSSL